MLTHAYSTRTHPGTVTAVKRTGQHFHTHTHPDTLSHDNTHTCTHPTPSHSQMHSHSCAHADSQSYTQFTRTSHTRGTQARTPHPAQLGHAGPHTQAHTPHPAQLGHAGHVERRLGILVGVVLPEEVVDLVIVALVLVHNGGLNELRVWQGHIEIGVRPGSLLGVNPQVCTNKPRANQTCNKFRRSGLTPQGTCDCTPTHTCAALPLQRCHGPRSNDFMPGDWWKVSGDLYVPAA